MQIKYHDTPDSQFSLTNGNNCPHFGGALPSEAHLFLKARATAANDNDIYLCAFGLAECEIGQAYLSLYHVCAES